MEYPSRQEIAPALSRRKLLTFAAACCLPGLPRPAAGESTLKFGLTPVFLNNDIELLSRLKDYLSRQTGQEVQLVQRRTYEEITTLLLSGQLTAAWICGYPLVQYRDQLSPIAVPLWNGQPLYSSYLIVPKGRSVAGIEELRGDLHAFSDPNSNSGYLVTAALLAERGLRPEQFFRQTIFTYGHRNVVRAIASGLAQSGSVDGYVWEVMASIEPALTARSQVMRKSELLGFPPVACLSRQIKDANVLTIQKALIAMASDAGGREVLRLLRLDGFAEEPSSLFTPIADKMRLVRSLTQ
jgi:ABC-type phosphate/phosphonate transport system substrate-binding protein